jgi:hypothetical protein
MTLYPEHPTLQLSWLYECRPTSKLDATAVSSLFIQPTLQELSRHGFSIQVLVDIVVGRYDSKSDGLREFGDKHDHNSAAADP